MLRSKADVFITVVLTINVDRHVINLVSADTTMRSALPLLLLTCPTLMHLCSSHTLPMKIFLTTPCRMETGSVLLYGPTASRPAFYQDRQHQQNLGSLLEMQNLSPYPRPTESQSLEVRPSVLTSFSGFSC